MRAPESHALSVGRHFTVPVGVSSVAGADGHNVLENEDGEVIYNS